MEVFLETLRVAQPARKLPAKDGNLKVATVFSRARKCPHPEPDESSPHHHAHSPDSLLILSSQPRLGLSGSLYRVINGLAKQTLITCLIIKAPNYR